MLYGAKAIHSKGPKDLGRNRIKTADLNWPEGYFISYGIMWKEFSRGWKFISLSLLLLGAWGGEQLLVHFLYTLTYIL